MHRILAAAEWSAGVPNAAKWAEETLVPAVPGRMSRAPLIFAARPVTVRRRSRCPCRCGTDVFGTDVPFERGA
jgi:hypothetical protein